MARGYPTNKRSFAPSRHPILARVGALAVANAALVLLPGAQCQTSTGQTVNNTQPLNCPLGPLVVGETFLFLPTITGAFTITSPGVFSIVDNAGNVLVDHTSSYDSGAADVASTTVRADEPTTIHVNFAYSLDGDPYSRNESNTCDFEVVAASSGGNTNGGNNTGSGLPVAYDFTDIHNELAAVFTNPVSSSANAVNEGGIVVGVVNAADGQHAFRWQAGTHNVVDLGIGSATAINESGLVVGTEPDDVVGSHAAVFPGGRLPQLDATVGASAAALGVNDSGIIAGFAEVLDTSVDPPVHHAHACVWLSLQIVDLHDAIGLENSVATAINNQGRVVGYAYDGADSILSKPFVFQPSAPGSPTGTVTFLDISGHAGGQANAINEAGDVAGTLWDSSGLQLNGATLWTSTARVALEASQADEISAALGLNNSDLVVGFVGSAPFVWDGLGHTLDVSSFITGGVGTGNPRCNAVSDALLLVGQRILNGSGQTTRAFALQAHL